jgi:carbamoyl-phosphate synthase large subunit
MKKINVLITAISSSNSLGFIWGLRKEKEMEFLITGTDIYERYLSVGAQFCDNFFKIPMCKEPSFVEILLEICRKNTINVLVPILDEEMLVISKRENDFLALGTRVLLPKREVIDICFNKLNLHSFLTRNSFPTPVIYTGPQFPETFPVIQKLVIGRGSRDITIIHNEEEFKKAQGKDEYLIQKYIEGQEFTVDTLSNLQGKVLITIPRLRLEIKEGKSIKAQTVRNKIIENLAERICNALGMVGPACLQCKLGEDGVPYFFDVNLRVGSASILTIEAGINIPVLAVKNILGQKIDDICGEFRENVVMLRYWGQVFTYPDKCLEI